MSGGLARVRGTALLGALLASACTGLFHSTVQPEQTYYLRPLPAGGDAVVPAAAASAPSLRVSRPVADPGLDTSHIVLVQPDRGREAWQSQRKQRRRLKANFCLRLHLVPWSS